MHLSELISNYIRLTEKGAIAPIAPPPGSATAFPVL